MKKIFLFAVAAFAALSMNAQVQQVVWSESDVAAKLDGKSYGAGLILTCTDQAGKMAIDANNTYFGDANSQIKFTHRLKSGGKSQVKDDATNAILLKVPAAGKLYIYARNSSKNTEGRVLSLSQFGAELFNHEFYDSEAVNVKGLDSKEPEKETPVFPVFTCDVAKGEVEVSYTGGAINFYGFSLNAPADPDAKQAIEVVGIESVKAVKRVVDGQVVIERDGRLFNLLGAEIAR